MQWYVYSHFCIHYIEIAPCGAYSWMANTIHISRKHGTHPCMCMLAWYAVDVCNRTWYAWTIFGSRGAGVDQVWPVTLGKHIHLAVSSKRWTIYLMIIKSVGYQFFIIVKDAHHMHILISWRFYLFSDFLIVHFTPWHTNSSITMQTSCSHSVLYS